MGMIWYGYGGQAYLLTFLGRRVYSRPRRTALRALRGGQRLPDSFPCGLAGRRWVATCGRRIGADRFPAAGMKKGTSLITALPSARC